MKESIIIFCNQCGNRNPDDAIFCNSCGAKIGVTNQNSRIYQRDETINQKTSGKALTSLILGLLSLFILFIDNFFIAVVLGIIGLILGFAGMADASEYESTVMPKFAIICNLISVLIPVMFMIAFI